MQKQLGASHPEIHLLAVNAAGLDHGNSVMAEEGDLPLLQDHEDVDAWGLWQATYRDVVILGRDNELLDIYNLTDHDLDDSANYATLAQMLTDAAEASSP